jgi:hypothetical protein
MTTFQMKLSSEDRLVPTSKETPDDLVPTFDAQQIVGGSNNAAPSESVDDHETS